MRTTETDTVFRRDIDGARMMQGRTPEYIERWIVMERERHAAYDERFDRMLAAVQAIERPESRAYVCDLLAKSGGPGYLSGSSGWCGASDVLKRYGVLIHEVFDHDRRGIARMCDGIVRAAPEVVVLAEAAV